MLKAQTEILCRHPNCKCAPLSDGEYCSEYCKDADRAGTPEIVCECGHPECQT